MVRKETTLIPCLKLCSEGSSNMHGKWGLLSLGRPWQESGREDEKLQRQGAVQSKTGTEKRG